MPGNTFNEVIFHGVIFGISYLALDWLLEPKTIPRPKDRSLGLTDVLLEINKNMILRLKDREEELSQCEEELSQCEEKLSQCEEELSQCEEKLSRCEEELSQCKAAVN